MVTDIVTVAIPVFERFDYFEAALNSIFNQTVVPKVIVVDNCSSHCKFSKFCIQNEIPYFRNESNLGMFGNWNKCFEYSDTEYVMILGDDDFLEPTFVEKFLNAKREHQNIDIWFSDFIVFNYSTTSTSNHRHIFPFGKNIGEKVLEYGIKYSLGFPVISSVFKKNIFSGFYEQEHGSNDWVWIYENAQNLLFYGEEQKLLNYGKHEHQDSKNPLTHLKCIASLAYIYDDMSKRIESSSLKKLASSKSNYYKYYFYLNSKADFLTQYLANKGKYSSFLKKNTYGIKRTVLIAMPVALKQILFKIYFRLKLSVIAS
jgi:glycosyltransferase involved in cell wall biosynthesis